MCRFMKVSRSSYYEWLNNISDIRNEKLLPIKNNCGIISGFKKPNLFNVYFGAKEILCTPIKIISSCS